MECFLVELGPWPLQGLLYVSILFEDETAICRLAAVMGLISSGTSVLRML